MCVWIWKWSNWSNQHTCHPKHWLFLWDGNIWNPLSAILRCTERYYWLQSLCPTTERENVFLLSNGNWHTLVNTSLSSTPTPPGLASGSQHCTVHYYGLGYLCLRAWLTAHTSVHCPHCHQWQNFLLMQYLSTCHFKSVFIYWWTCLFPCLSQYNAAVNTDMHIPFRPPDLNPFGSSCLRNCCTLFH